MHELKKTSLGDLEVLTITSGKYKQNSYIVTSQGTNDAIIVDAGLEFELLSKTLADNNLNPYVLLLTHGHFDHITCAEIVVKHYGIDCLIHNSDIKLVKQAGFYAYRFLKKKLLPPRNLTYFNNFPSLNWPGVAYKLFILRGIPLVQPHIYLVRASSLLGILFLTPL